MKMMLSLAMLLMVAPLSGQRPERHPMSMGGGDCAANVYNCSDTPNPLPTASTVWIDEMTWMDVRDALNAGKTTAIISTGGVEPNGPWLVTGKHNYVLRANCEAIAKELGNALCTPIVKFVPEGSIEPQTSHMTSPGTISLQQETFEALLTDVAHSLKVHGFENIIFIGDSGGNQSGQRAVAEKLNAQWGGSPLVAHVQEYYDYGSVSSYMAGQGLVAGESDNLHDDPVITLNMMITDPNSVRYDERLEAGFASINGVSIADRVESLEQARKIVQFRAWTTSESIKKAMLNGGTLPVPERSARAGGRGGQERPAPDPRTMGGGDCRQNEYNCSDTPNPLPAANTVWIEEMTWMDVRDALNAGKTTAIISTGGVEPNGPWLVTGKHNYVLAKNCEAIARKLGDALCAPILKFVPEGSIEPQTGHMTSPGTISLQQETFEAVLTDVAHSLKMHGFENIIFIGDSGGNQSGQAAVAERLTARWNGSTVVAHIGEYYRAPAGSRNVLRERGVQTEGMPSDGLHDSPGITLNMLISDTKSVRWEERVKTGQAIINGVSIADLSKSLELAQEIVDARTDRTVDLIKSAISGN
ncbi:MAG: creatininase family protein [Longimicrobiales bacterium]|nr:creatininase family protein [Longimicrobiales bacterium]